MRNDDALWPEFEPLWRELKKESSRTLLVAGGYGLFLKQVWLGEKLQTPIVVPFERWIDATPRVTKDLDLIVDLDFVVDQEANEEFAAVLQKNGFVSDRNPRWQFEKSLGPNRKVIVDLHAPLPLDESANLAVDRIRIKHKPSLGSRGIHVRQNPEAFGAHFYPFSFAIDGLTIAVPNSISWSIMKLTAMRDQWVRSQEEHRGPADRDLLRQQAIKHARDACRIAALMTADERSRTAEIKQEITAHVAFDTATAIADEYFIKNDGLGIQFARDMRQEADLELIRTMIAEWFA